MRTHLQGVALASWLSTFAVYSLSSLAACGAPPPKQADSASLGGDGTAGSSSGSSGSDGSLGSAGSSSAGGSGSSGTGSTDGSGSSAASSGGGSSGTGAGSAANASSPPARRADEYDKEHTDIVLTRAARQVKVNCGSATDDTGKPSGPWGKVTISVTLGRNGHSKGVTVPAPYDGTPPGRCIAQAFSNLTFPPWGGSDTQVNWDVELVKPAGGK